MYPRFFLRLEPLGLDTIAVVVCVAGHDVWLLDLRVESHRIASHRNPQLLIRKCRPDVACLSSNYLTNIPRNHRSVESN